QVAGRMIMRHASSRVDPLLSEHAMRMSDSGKVHLAGVPLTVSSEWLAEGMTVPRLAPEERKTEDRRPSGDLWRLGHLLLELSKSVAQLPDGARALFDQLAADD